MKLLPCPLCARPAKLTKLDHPKGSPTYNVSCGMEVDDGCGLVLFGGLDTRNEMIVKWNRRQACEVTS